MTAERRRAVERAVLRAGVRWVMLSDFAAELDNKIGDVKRHPLVGKFTRAERARERAEKHLVSMIRDYAGALGHMP